MNMERRGFPVWGIVAIVLVILGAITAGLSIETVPEGSRGVVTKWGKVTGRTLGPGMNFLNPIGVDVISVNVRTRKFEQIEEAATKDQQDVQATVVVAYHPEPQRVGQIYTDHGLDYEAKLVTPGVTESIKVATAHYSAEQLVTQRAQASDEISKIITAKLAANGIIADSVNLINYQFSADYTKAIEDKVAAEQLAKTEEMRVRIVTAQAEQAVVAAKGEAEAIALMAKALADAPDVLKLKQIEMMREKWDGIMPRVVGADGMSLLMTTGE